MRPNDALIDRISPQDEEREYFATGGAGRSHEFYTGEEQFRREMRSIFGRKWLPVDHVSRLSQPGQYATVDIGPSSVLLINGDEGIQAFHNYCRHRGYKLVEESYGRRQSLVCIYHCWVYDKNGALKKNNGTYLDHFFDRDVNGLLRIATETRHGVVFISFADEPEDIDQALGEFGVFAEAYDLERLTCAQWKDYPVACNWKLVAHNVNESLHFPTAHKDLHAVTDFDDAGTYTLEGDIVGAWQQMREGYNSVSLTGVSDRQPLPNVPEGDVNRINWITILPTLLFGFTADYVMMQWVWPQTPDSCYVRHFWLFDPAEADKPTFNHDAVFNLWDKANYEDWELCERTHRGLANPYWQPGILSLDEEVVSQIDEWVAANTSTQQEAVDGTDARPGDEPVRGVA